MSQPSESSPNAFTLRIIGERINPGFRSTQAMFDEEDFSAIQRLAVRQAEAGALCLNVNAGVRAQSEPEFAAAIVRAIQDVVDIPLSLDSPHPEVLRACLLAYDDSRAQGRLPIINSITEHRWDLMRLRELRPFQVILMASERVVDGLAKPNKTADEIADTARRAVRRLREQHGMQNHDVLIDVSVCAIVADTEGLNRATLDAIAQIHADPDLSGVHMMGGLSNIGQQLPAKAADGSNLKDQLENAFLTLAVPRGFDTILGTPWRVYQPLPEDSHVLTTYRQFLEQTGSNALRAVRRLYRGGS